MERKKWTPTIEITDSLLKLREKKKWQLALRRYVLEKNICASYACYFGLPIIDFREWIQIQFTYELNWDNFGSLWQFEHIIPVAYFDFAVETDLLLCWNFINIRVERLSEDAGSKTSINVLAARGYFENLYKKTNFGLCAKMIDKINSIENKALINEPAIENFIINKTDLLQTLASLEKEAFNRLNTGTSLKDILKEIELFKRFG